MKISKLFHWLYAALMFLPLVFFLPSLFYYGFNEHATNTETTTINYKYQSNEVNTIDDLVEGNIYSFEGVLTFTEKDYNYEGLTLTFYSGYLEYSGIDSLTFDGYINDNKYSCFYSDNLYFVRIANSNFDYEIDNFYLEDFIFSFNNLSLFKNWWLNNEISEDLPQYTDYNVIESVDTNVQDTISNKMYLAWESIWNLPLFVWTKNSFVSAPFTYITGLFGLSSTNSLNYVFTYFVSISICWLVFDLIMYVPNLAHKWIDKGAIE